MTEPVDLLGRRVYGIHQVDRILGLRGGTAERWIDGYTRAGKAYQPVVRLEATHDDVVTWGEFTEARFLSEYRTSGVPMIRMRPAVERLREQFDRKYPLASAAPWLEVVGRELVLKVQTEIGLERELLLVVVRNGQVVLNEPARRFVRSAVFEDGSVARLHPQDDLERVVIDPLRQFGEPVVRSVPTEIIAEQVRAGARLAEIADSFELTLEDVEQAIRYELLRGQDARAA